MTKTDLVMSQVTQSGSPVQPRRNKLACKLLLCGLGIILVACCLIYLPCINEVRETTARGYAINNLKQITLSFHLYYEDQKVLPPAAIKDKVGRPLLSWRVAILPYIEQDNLYKEFRLDEPWDSPQNMKQLERMPRTFQSDWGSESGRGMTLFQVFVGPGTAFERDDMTFKDFPNGLGNTVFVVHAAKPVPWTKPEDLIYDANGPLPQFIIHNQQHHFLCYRFGKIPSYMFGLGDGSVRLIRNDTPESTIRSLITRNGGEKVDASKLE